MGTTTIYAKPKPDSEPPPGAGDPPPTLVDLGAYGKIVVATNNDIPDVGNDSQIPGPKDYRVGVISGDFMMMSAASETTSQLINGIGKRKVKCRWDLSSATAAASVESITLFVHAEADGNLDAAINKTPNDAMTGKARATVNVSVFGKDSQLEAGIALKGGKFERSLSVDLGASASAEDKTSVSVGDQKLEGNAQSTRGGSVSAKGGAKWEVKREPTDDPTAHTTVHVVGDDSDVLSLKHDVSKAFVVKCNGDVLAQANGAESTSSLNVQTTWSFGAIVKTVRGTEFPCGAVEPKDLPAHTGSKKNDGPTKE